MAENELDFLNDAKDPETTLTNEAESERFGSAATSTEVLSNDDVQKKALDKFNAINKPTDRATAENLAKLATQIHSAEEQVAAAPIYQGTAHPEHQTYGSLGIPMAALTHDYDEDRVVVAQATVQQKPKDPEVAKHNAEIKNLVEVLEKSAQKDANTPVTEKITQD